MAIVLVDTSIWLDVHRGQYDIQTRVQFEDVVICPAIAQELLQGAQEPAQYERVWATLFATRMLDDPTPLEAFEEAAHIYRLCRDDGYIIASAHDCLIAACAIRHGVPLLHRDQDFEQIARVTDLTVLPNR